jgi:hypothetical protein
LKHLDIGEMIILKLIVNKYSRMKWTSSSDSRMCKVSGQYYRSIEHTGSIKTGNLFEQISGCHYHKDVDSSRWPLSLKCVHADLVLLYWHPVHLNFVEYFSENHMASTFSVEVGSMRTRGC